MKNKSSLKKLCFFLIFAVTFPLVAFLLHTCIELQIVFERPDLIYKGNKTVPKEDVIRYGKITLRDLRLDQYRNYGEYTRHFKYYIVKKNFLSRKRLYKQLSQYCVDYYKSLNIYDYDDVRFFFYEECGTMPWFWNNEGYFPDLEMNSENLICKCFVSKEGIKLIEGGW